MRFFPYRLVALTCVCLIAGCGGAETGAHVCQEPPLWTEAERKTIKDYWGASGRYRVEDAPEPERVNVTVPGSTWYWNYNKAVPTQNEAIKAAWQAWFEKKQAAEKAKAGGDKDVPDAGPLPSLLKDLVGEPPALYEKVQPRQYTVTFAPTDAQGPYRYTDCVSFGDRPAYYGYFRSKNGVRYFGRRVKDFAPAEKAALTALFARVTTSPMEQHVMQAVSALEGGWDAINTYDTGWVSIGFIQFITTVNGDGSLASVLARHKADDPADFQQTFHRFGLDVTPGIPVIAIINPQTGEEKRGTDAVRVIIEDKRLTAVFQRAGERDGFRRAQIAIAKVRYWPGDDLITVTQTTLKETSRGKQRVLGVYFNAPNAPLPAAGQALLDALPQKQKADPTYQLTPEQTTLSARVSDLFKSEAGLATLMDRKVNRGTLGPLSENVAKLMQEKKLNKLADVTRYDRDLVVAQKFRHDFLSDPTLTQPSSSGSPTIVSRQGPAPAKPIRR